MKIEGLDKFTRTLKELERAMAGMDGEIAEVSFNPADPESIEQAIQTAIAAIDARIAGYERNEIVVSIADAFKENARQAILDRALEARLEKDERK